MSSQQLQAQLQKQHSTDTNNYVTEKGKHEDNSHKASFENNIVDILLFLPYIRKESTKVRRTRK
jgi:hypothetical protein